MKLFIIVRRDLTPGDAIAQASHAVAEFCLHSSRAPEWNNHTLVILMEKNEDRLHRLMLKSSWKGMECHPFYEPDMEGSLTAFACYAEDSSFPQLPLFSQIDLKNSSL